jgi:hypothetical protein
MVGLILPPKTAAA